MIARFLLSVFVSVMLMSGAASAQSLQRNLPQGLLVTTIKANGGATIWVGKDSKAVLLSPVVQIRSADNRLILPMNLHGVFRVGLKWDLQNMLSRIWILSDAEYTALTGKPVTETEQSKSTDDDDSGDTADDDDAADDGDSDSTGASDSVNG